MEGAISATVIEALGQVRGAIKEDVSAPVIEFHESTLAPVQTTPKLSVSSPQKITGEKIERNDPCPCGSGKKYKKCGELNTEEHQRLMGK